VAHSILFLDEPTVFLPETEVEFLFDLIRTVVREGAGVVFISHDLSAVRTVCDRAVVLRDGAVVGRTPLAGVSDDQLVELIVGAATGKRAGYGHRGTGDGRPAPRPLCEVRELRGGRVADVSLDIRATEIVGLAGLLGSGAEDVPYLLFGSMAGRGGRMTVDGWTASVPKLKPFEAVQRKVAMVPADRRRDGIAPTLTVSENATILVNHEHTSYGRLRLRRLRKLVHGQLERFNVRPRDPGAATWRLSGGNQQRVVLAKWLEIHPRLLLLHEPTQGVDVAARAQIYRMVRDATGGGMGALWVSSDFEELATVCDRVVVLAAGRVRAELSGDELTEDKISSAVYHYSTGTASDGHAAGEEDAPRAEGRHVDD
jgi:ribose transport system ATP-binding protein